MSTDNQFLTGLEGELRHSAYVYVEDAFRYNSDKRPRRDTIWTSVYVLLAAFIFAGSIPVFLRTDPNAGLYSNRFYNNSTTCDVRKYQQVAWMYNDSVNDPTFMRRFKAEIAIWLPATAGVALLCSALYLFLFSRFPRTMVGILTLGSLVAGSALAALCLTGGARALGIALAACTAVGALFYLWAGRWVHTLSDLFAMAAHSLRRSPLLLMAALAINVVGWLVLAYSLGALFSAVNNGFVARNWDAVRWIAVDNENGFCLNEFLNRIPCCLFITHSWAYAFAAAAALFALWSGSLAMQMRTFVAADTLTQSYFAAYTTSALNFSNLDIGMSAQGGTTDFMDAPAIAAAAAAEPPPPVASSFSSASASTLSWTSSAATLRRALLHSLTASFGSLAAAAAVLEPLRAVRYVSQALTRTKYIGHAAACVLHPLTSATRKFSRFAVPSAALTGRPFFPAAHGAFELMQQNLLPPYGLWWLPEWLLQVAVVLLALSWAAFVFLVSYSSNKQYKPVVLQVSLANASTAFFLMLYGLLFMTSLQLDAVHSLYICYAMDNDQRRVTHLDVHAVLRKVPGQTVQRHRNALVYGAADAPVAVDLQFSGSAASLPSSGLLLAAAPTVAAAGSSTATATAAVAVTAPLSEFQGSDLQNLSSAAQCGITAGTSSRLKRRGP